MSVKWIGGHVWCNDCEKPWKECPCPGESVVHVVITKELMESLIPEMGAFIKAVEDKV